MQTRSWHLGGDVTLRDGRPRHVAGLASAGGEESREFHCKSVLWLSESVMRAFKLRVKLRVGRLAGPYRDAQVCASAVVDGDAAGGSAQLVDELQKSEMF